MAKFIKNLSLSQSLDGGTPKGKKTFGEVCFLLFFDPFFVAPSCML